MYSNFNKNLKPIIIVTDNLQNNNYFSFIKINNTYLQFIL